MKTYSKGARGERELLHFLNYKGFAVIRAPSSGGFITPVDIIAIKNGTVLAFEIKAWSRKPKINKKQLNGLRSWCNRAGAMGFIAWRSSGNKWMFLPLKDAETNKYEDENWIKMEDFLDVLMIK